jgi:hypothetical protein
MNKLTAQIEAALRPGMILPNPLRLLFDWIEANGYVGMSAEGIAAGALYPQDELHAGWSDHERPGGTVVAFGTDGNESLGAWFGHTRREVLDALTVFAQTGGDGSMAALWLAPDSSQKIVHLGSGSGSTLVCVLAEDPIDFLRLIAIGYDEICWDAEFGKPPNSTPGELIVHPNEPFRHWVATTFGVSIPSIAAEIVKHPASMDDGDEEEDVFSQWVKKNT